ncbi:MAG TPA: type II toxin-antitoxin system VapC family toxin [Candidatus Nanoarchaeia archaeon]|nr:type II toxin-antitoxin system VapC family toxin [Candidatus Nanoarchaeia archaeon]
MEEKPTYYLDSNIFIYASSRNDALGQAARRLLQAIQAGTFRGVTSCLTLDEVMYVLKKILPADLLAAGEQILNLDIKFLSIEKPLLYAMLSLMEEHSLQPRDALHLATMHANNISLIVSEDKDFDNISFIERRSVLSLAL